MKKEKIRQEDPERIIQELARKRTDLILGQKLLTKSTGDKILVPLANLPTRKEKLIYAEKLLEILNTSKSDQEILKRAEEIM